MRKNVLLVDGGGRGHALAWKLYQSLRVNNLYVAPGNGGTQQVAYNVPIAATDIKGLLEFAKKNVAHLTVVGQDEPLALGIVDAFRSHGLRIFGPTYGAVQIEASKSFAKELMANIGIPTASFRVFRDYEEALEHIRIHGAPVVVKASGLALGKGVYVCQTLADAEQALHEIMVQKVHKDAGEEVVIEDYLEGPEISIHAFSDGKTAQMFPPAQDHKPIFDGDLGKNTGGMGAIAPVPWVTKELLSEAECKIVQPVLKELSAMGRPFTGCLYPGLKKTSSGLKVLEFNARFGDPETQAYMRLLRTDIMEIMEACLDGNLGDLKIEWAPGFAVCIVLASGGYPDAYSKGFPITGIDKAEALPGVVVFHAGTSFTDCLRTSGGRVLGVTAVGGTLKEALDRAYAAVPHIHFENIHYRKDIGAKALL